MNSAGYGHRIGRDGRLRRCRQRDARLGRDIERCADDRQAGNREIRHGGRAIRELLAELNDDIAPARLSADVDDRGREVRRAQRIDLQNARGKIACIVRKRPVGVGNAAGIIANADIVVAASAAPMIECEDDLPG